MTEHGSDTDDTDTHEPTDETTRADPAAGDDTAAGGSTDRADAHGSETNAATASDETDADGGRGGVRKVLYWTVLGGLVLFGGMMVLLVYSDVRSLISVFVGRRYQLLIQTAFHLVLVLCAGIGVSLIVRRIERLPG
jgi:hypothetical protein